MTQKQSFDNSGADLLQTIDPKGIADESMRRTVEILLNLIEQLQSDRSQRITGRKSTPAG